MKEKEQLDVNDVFYKLINREISDVQLNQKVEYNNAFKDGNKIFESNYFSGLLILYRDKSDDEYRPMLGRMILSIMQLQLGALSENLSRSINDNLFRKKDEQIDIFDDFGDLISLDYNAAGVSGLNLLLEKINPDTTSPYGIIIKFTQKIIEKIYSTVSYARMKNTKTLGCQSVRSFGDCE